MSYNNRTRSQHSVCKRAISNRQNARRKVNPRTGWSTGAHIPSPFVARERFSSVRVSRSRANGLCASHDGNTCRARCTVRPARGPVQLWYLYLYIRMYVHAYPVFVHRCIIRAYTAPRSVLARAHTHTHAPRRRTRIGVYITTEYCIMQPLIAVLSFTHAICCSRCNPCSVTASSVQSPSR